MNPEPWRIPEPTRKGCTRCERWLPLEDFGPNRRLSSGLNSWCRACAAEATRAWRARMADDLEYKARKRERDRARYWRRKSDVKATKVHAAFEDRR